jgi:DNA uptake protein ComE-like DNA-binding protein
MILKPLPFFTKIQIKGSLAVVVVVFLCIGVAYFHRIYTPKSSVEFKPDLLNQTTETLLLETSENTENEEYTPISSAKSYHPQTIKFNELLSIGFDKKEAAIFLSYRKKSPPFESSDDILQIKTIDNEKLIALLYECNWPITKNKITENTNYQTATNFNTVKKEIQKIELNTADSVSLIQLRGIGGYRASKIIKLRNRLGGFYTINQLKEINGFNDSLLTMLSDQITIDTLLIRKININKDDSLMNKHPYFWNGVAKSIISYRKQHGMYQQLADLKKLYLLSDEKIKQIAPYIEF